jgi:hypothetical protein
VDACSRSHLYRFVFSSIDFSPSRTRTGFALKTLNEDAAFVGMLNLAYMSARMKTGTVEHCAFPALEYVVAQAAAISTTTTQALKDRPEINGDHNRVGWRQDAVCRPDEGDAEEYQLTEVGDGVRLRKGTGEALMEGLQHE